MNNNGYKNTFFNSFTDVVSSKITNTSWNLTFYGIVNYDRIFTSGDIATLNARPKINSDFRNSTGTSAIAGRKYVWGADINYQRDTCSLGYWPPRSGKCPVPKRVNVKFPLIPAPEATSTGCYIGKGIIG